MGKYYLGTAGRKTGSLAQALILFNEVIDDKRLGLWLKSALDVKETNEDIDKVKRNDQCLHPDLEIYIFYLSW